MTEENKLDTEAGHIPENTPDTKQEKTLKEEFAQAEQELTEAEKALFQHKKEELMAKWLIIGGFWGCLLGALINHFLFGGEWLSGVYTGLPVGLALGVAAGWIFGALEKAMLLEHIGKYARTQTQQQTK